jgi:hypothetical protein
MSLALVEAIGGKAVATSTAAKLGVRSWGTEHRTADFGFGETEVADALRAIAAAGKPEKVEVPIDDGIDEIALALRVDAWGRTYRSKVLTTNQRPTAIQSRHGLTIVPDAAPTAGQHVLPRSSGPSVPQLDQALLEIERRYGGDAVHLVKLGMEYDEPAR